jgi:hypothetical protein
MIQVRRASHRLRKNAGPAQIVTPFPKVSCTRWMQAAMPRTDPEGISTAKALDIMLLGKTEAGQGGF